MFEVFVQFILSYVILYYNMKHYRILYHIACRDVILCYVYGSFYTILCNTSIDLCVYIYTYVHTPLCIYLCIYTHIHMHIYTYLYMQVCIYREGYAHVHMLYIYIYHYYSDIMYASHVMRVPLQGAAL